MTESNKSMSRKISQESEGSLVLVESSGADIPGTEEATSPPIPEQVPSIATSTFSSDSHEQEDTPIVVATDAQVVKDETQARSFDTLSIEEGRSSDDEVDDIATQRKVGAGITIGVVTAPICGPVLAVAAGFAAAYGTTKEGVAGDACRAAGDVALVAKEKAIAVDKKHGIVKKTKNGANQLLDKAKAVDKKHQILEKMKQVVILTLKNIAAALQFAADKMKETREKRKAARQARSFANDDAKVPSSGPYEKVSCNAEVV